ncbi:MAG: F0F1 ATP synthase subunit delta [Acidimicrobiales bacterium]
MNPEVEGYTAALREPLSTSSRRRLAEELSAVARLVEGSPQLAAALADTAVPPSARQGILTELLSDKVAQDTLGLVSFAVSATKASEVSAALGWLATRVDEGSDEQAPLGHVAARERLGGYAAALFEHLDVDQLSKVEDQLFRFARIVESTPKLRAALTDRELRFDARAQLVSDLLAGKVEDATCALAGFVARAGRPRDFVGSLDWLVARAASARGWRVADVRTAEPIADSQREAIERVLSGLAKGPVELRVTVDEELLAGAVIEVGDLRLDATARGRLERLRAELAIDAPEPAGLTDRQRGTNDRAHH